MRGGFGLRFFSAAALGASIFSLPAFLPSSPSTCFIGCGAAASSSLSTPSPTDAQASFEWRGNYFLAHANANAVYHVRGDLTEILHVFRNLPGAHDVWVDTSAVLHVWILSGGETMVRRIDVATQEILGDVRPEDVHHGSHQCNPPSRLRTIGPGLLPRCDVDVGVGEAMFLKSLGFDPGPLCSAEGLSDIPVPSGAIEIGPWLAAPGEEVDEFCLKRPLRDFVVILAPTGQTGATPVSGIQLDPDTNLISFPAGATGVVYLWTHATTGSPTANPEPPCGFRFYRTRTGPGTPPSDIALRITPPEVSPLDGRGSISITTTSGTPGPIRVTARRIANTGGHVDAGHASHGGNAPPGRDPFIQFASGPQGPWLREITTPPGSTIHFQIGQPGIGGVYEIRAKEGDAPCDAHAEARVTVRVEDLGQLQEGVGLRLVGGNCNHHGPSDAPGVPAECKTPDDNHWGTSFLRTTVFYIGLLWDEKHPQDQLRINDMSLPLGGKFDIGSPTHGIPSGSWGLPRESHTMKYGHGHGRAVDIGFVIATPNGNRDRREEVFKILDRAGLQEIGGAPGIAPFKFFRETKRVHFHVMR